MKRLILFLGLILLSVATMFAQTTARTAVQRTLKKGVTYYKYTGVTADSITNYQDTLFFEILSNKNTPVTCNARIEFTVGESEAEDYEIRLQGKVFENDTWTSLVDSTAQTASLSLYEPETSMVDSTGVPNAMPGSGDNFYRYFRMVLANDGDFTATDTCNVDYVIFKLYER